MREMLLRGLKKTIMKYEPMDLWDSIEVECAINCSNCQKRGVLHFVDDDEASHAFFKKGWRATKSKNVYCPECAKKKLKQ